MRILPAGDTALLVELDTLAQATALLASLVADPIPGAGEPVPGARTLLVPFRPHAVSASGLAAALRSRPLVRPDDDVARVVDIPTVYDGEDLTSLAALLGWSPEELVRRHTAATWTVGFMGFAPGFSYLTCTDPAWPQVPRLGSPRTRVPAGAVALAGPYAGVYPRVSPGGWQLVGQTDAAIWDATRTPPVLWAPGDVVRFQPVPPDAVNATRRAPGAEPAPIVPGADATPDLDAGRAVLVVDAGRGTLIQDLGRTGVAHLGVGQSGAADPRSLRAANRAVGNPPGAAAIETEGLLRIRASGDVVVALTGALVTAHVRRDAAGGGVRERPAPSSVPFLLHDGEELALGEPTRGRRTYVAMRGGVDVPVTLGSRSTDTLGGVGPAPLTAGTVLPVGADVAAAVETGDVGAPDPASLPTPGQTTTLRIVVGPHPDWFDDGAATLTAQEWEVTALADRVGIRLAGRPLRRTAARADAELPSEGMVTGAVQVPPNGQPILFLPDHPVTGGYPPVAVVVTADLPLLGQLPTSARVRFARTDEPGA
ncbi:urea amidolyase related protein [Xylanimonas cellulosilytica DSM 15894]|uniref:Urea amidolyase related protein n=1 Tax=Xylanimonas cellulosilytica (strain DSM 15894 / JCM 12276 / CECT 5975 / KCTC 9989 / LMG 20990 / NBRC 107835 / XIL07) TaxID=446471 RepID=D1BTV9_XYLCX|nr:urea amidolyase family protein [Xylanimonas cellulosilytica]ACZ29123.1 urea amidolyase related protein [Xylanimonas cellulosilytica DSM 15894]